MSIRRLLSPALLLVFGLWLAAFATHGIAGETSGAALDGSVWATANDRGHIRFEDCGDGELCGALVWFHNLETEPDRDHVDRNNPDPDLRGRPLLGTRLMWGFERDDDGWKNGRIYRPKNGATYRARITRVDDETLRVEGCLFIFCRGQEWTRLEEPYAEAGSDKGSGAASPAR